MSSRFTLTMFLLLVLVMLPACGGDDNPVAPEPPKLDMQYDQVTWLTSHNAFAYFDWDDVAPDHGLCVNQQTSIAQQLQNGVRAFQLDIHFWNNNDPSSEPVVYLCHGTRELPIPMCAQLRFTPLQEELQVIGAFLAANPYEVVTLMMEDYVHDEPVLLATFEAVLMPGSGRDLADLIYNPSGLGMERGRPGPLADPAVDGRSGPAAGRVLRSRVRADSLRGPLLPGQLLRLHRARRTRLPPGRGPRRLRGQDVPDVPPVRAAAHERLGMSGTEHRAHAGPDQHRSIDIARWESSCAPELGRPPGFLSVDFADGCPNGRDLCDPAAIMYSGPLDAVKHFNQEVWPAIRSR